VGGNLKARPDYRRHVRDTYLFAYSQTGESYGWSESGQILHLEPSARRPAGCTRRCVKARIVYPTFSSLEGMTSPAGIKNDPHASGGEART